METDDYNITPLDNTRVVIPIKPLPHKMVATTILTRDPGMLYDTEKASVALNLLNLYNTSYFGAGFGQPLSTADPRTVEGQLAIQLSLRYAMSNVRHMFEPIVAGYYGAPRLFINGVTTDIAELAGNELGEGAEAVVFDNSPNTVVKVSDALDETRNTIPLQEKLKRVGTINIGGEPMDVFTLRKVNVVNEDQFPILIKRLDKRMRRRGWTPLLHGKDKFYRSYAKDGLYITEVSPGNIGTDIFGRPVMIDALPVTANEFFEFTEGENILPVVK